MDEAAFEIPVVAALSAADGLVRRDATLPGWVASLEPVKCALEGVS